VQSDRNPPTPPYKDNHLKQPLINRKKERAPVAADFGERRNTPRDLRFYHPALRAIRELTKSSPAKIIWDDLIDALGMEPDTGRLKKCLRVWVKNGFKEHNYGWAIDWYLYGIPEKYTLPNQQDRGYKRDITGRPAAEIDYSSDPGAPCGYCGDQYCLKTHIEDRRTAGDELAA
jgi:hypothetical protein